MDRIVKGTQRTGRLVAFQVLWGIAVFCAGILLMGSLECQAREWTGQEGQMAEAVYTNPDTGYQVYVEDEAELLTEAERRELSQAMEEITAYGNAAFVTTRENSRSTERFARNYYTDRFGTDSGTVFVIDMDNRMIWIHSDGAIYKTNY